VRLKRHSGGSPIFFSDATQTNTDEKAQMKKHLRRRLFCPVLSKIKHQYTKARTQERKKKYSNTHTHTHAHTFTSTQTIA
jgi:hypothetical protein